MTSPAVSQATPPDAAEAAVDTAAATAQPRTLWQRMRQKPVMLVAMGVLVLMYLAVVLLPIIMGVDPTTPNPLMSLAPASPGHPLGTDELGRDEFARLLAGGRITLTVAWLSITIAILVGTAIGGLAGYYRGWVEAVLMRFVDAVMAIPAFFLILAELAVFGNSPPVVVIVIGLNFWTPVARMVYAEFLKWRQREFVEAGQALGASGGRIMLRHILPQVFPSMIVLVTLGVGWSILTESGLSYLGLGIQPPHASWGNMLQNAQTYIWTQPWLAVYPGLAIMTTVLSFNVLGNGLRDVTDPHRTVAGG